MKITESQLRQIIREESTRLLEGTSDAERALEDALYVVLDELTLGNPRVTTAQAVARIRRRVDEWCHGALGTLPPPASGAYFHGLGPDDD